MAGSALNTVMAYLAAIVLFRVTGKRTLSQMNAFDFVITLALGSTLASMCLDRSIPLIDGLVVFTLLVSLQLVLTFLSVRVKFLKKAITSQPRLLVYKGEVLWPALKKERVTQEELNMAARRKGLDNIGDIDAIVMETTGKLTVIPRAGKGKTGTLIDVRM